MGTQTWVAITIIFTEMLIVFKFDWDVVTIPPPFHITLIWSIAASLFFMWIVWNFFLKPHLNRHYEKKKNLNKKPVKSE